MKKLFTLLLLGGTLTMNAQQVNGSFDEDWVNCTPYTGGSSTTVGSQPQNWTISHVAGMKLGLSWTGKTVVAEKVEGFQGGYAVQLKNTYQLVKTIPAYITLGTPWNTAQDWGSSHMDGGTFGGKEFTNRPDGIKFYYKRTTADNSDQPASVIAYLWSGTWHQTNVPVNVVSGTNPTRKEMIDRDRNILNIETSEGKTPYTEDGKLIASINKLITETPSEWTEYIAIFDYKDKNAIPEKINIILAANDYFGAASAVAKENTLTVDEIKLIYYNTLSDLSYSGHELNFDENTFNYDLSDVEYDKSKLSYTKKAVGGTVEEKYNETSGVLTLLVTGDDGSSNSYQLTFKKPYSGEISSISYNGTPIQNFAQGTNHYYSVVGEYTEGCITATTADEGLNATVTYDATTRIATISVPESGKDIQYYVKFARETTSYESKLIISMMGAFVGSPAQSVGISDIRDGKIDLQLSNFELTGFGLIGDIYVHDINIDTEGRITKTDNIRIFGEVGNTLGDLPLELNGQITENELSCTLNITWMGAPIVVTVYPVLTPYIVATGITNLDLSAVQTGLTNPNCLIYADENASNLPNVIANGVCASMNITDGYELGVPQAFSATNITLNRTFPAGWSTICLPFATSTAAFGSDVKAQAFASADDNGLNFAEVTELDANKPYLIYFPSETTAPIYLSAEVETTTPVALTFGDFTFCGSYEASISMAGKYGVADQGDVQKLMLGGEGSTLKATRAYFTKSGDQPAMININLDGNATGIENIEQNQADIYDVYNLQGQLIRKNATSLNGLAKGIYIVNGKKVMVK